MLFLSRLLALPLLLALVTGCTSGSSPRATPSATPPATATATATSPAVAGEDPFDTIEPPTSLEVGRFPAILVNRAYAATRGFLALALLEPDTLAGRSTATLVQELQGTTQDGTVEQALSGPPSRAGLDIRPLLPAGATVPRPVATVTKSVYVAEEVAGLAGEDGLRITWTGTLAYPVTLRGTTSTVTYSTTRAYVFGTVPQDPAGLEMRQPIKGSATFGGVITACTAKGLLYPGPAAAACPV